MAGLCRAFVPSLRVVPSIIPSFLRAKRSKNRRGDDGMSSWYDDVDDNATPDGVFWEEMERQRLFNQLGGETAAGSSREREMAAASSSQSDSVSFFGGGTSTSTTAMGGMPDLTVARKPPSMEEVKSAEATLSEYTLFQVSDNWLDEDLRAYFQQVDSMKEEEEVSLDEETRRLEEQLEALPDGFGKNRASIWDDSDEEPWDFWGSDDSKTVDPDRANTLVVPEPSPDSEFFMNWDEPIDKAQDDAKFWERMKDCRTNSRRLQKAAASAKAKTFFQRPPNAREGYERLWVSAIDYACFKSLVGNIRNYGVEFADNFGDFMDGAVEDGLYTIEDMAAYKARTVFEVTGLPCVASRTSFEVEPVPPESLTSSSTTSGGPPSKASAATGVNNPKVLSGYRINDIDNHVDYLVDALQPLSEPSRLTRFTSCLCFYDGEMEIFEYGVCDVDMAFCHSGRTFIPMAQAIHNMVETLKMTFDLEYQKFLKAKRDDVSLTGTRDDGIGSASLKLRDRVLRDARVLPNDIVDVSEFMDSKVDVNLMDICAKELADLFVKQKPTKILTVATTGLVIALPMAKYLQVPVVYARKERTVVMAETYQAGFSSRTVGKNRELLVSKNHLDPTDRVLVVDDFLSSGASQEALLRIISDADATAVGVGVLLEKVYESGRQSLSGFNIPIRSLCRVSSVEDGVIRLLEEEGFEQK